MNAEQEVRAIIGEQVIQIVTLRHQVNDLSKQLDEARTRIAELENSDG